ncbi:PQQ-binding-like beta-propeller repeat protein [Aeoliella mucimassa]|uniref:Outer membrane protein assembly factor BamB n=1 Tax=Aeoliella mucimassa TaxID=2527972 RepID=A0A518AJB5_9BACT|nr:PQQ-binding-like beta-propeller repeat protein [Aeoliella mucimassa]QDU54815.1 Outer membrane protein assembly factor BamB precursor [Aeoliella mucimassa]
MLALLMVVSTAMADEWPRFRGPNGAGIAPALAIPDRWTPDDFAWQVDLAGSGHGSPVVHGDQLFVTSGSESGQVYLEAYAVDSGKRTWQQSLGGAPFRKHQLNAVASSTPAVDDKQVYVTYYRPGHVQLAAYTHAGKPVWEIDLGEFTCQHGFSASPIVIDDLVCLQGDNPKQGYLAAFDCSTGKQRWQATRDTGKEAYSTPATMTLANDKQVIVNSSQVEGITVIDPATGDKLWQPPQGFPERTVGSPVVAGDVVLAACGSGGGGKLMTACRITPTGCEQLYTLTKNIPYVPTGVAMGDLLFLIHDRGTMSCIDLSTQETLWVKRLGGGYYCSPILLGDRILCVSMEGEAIMLSAGREFQVLGRTDLGEGTEATPAVADGRLFIRTSSKLFCVAE